MSNTDNIKQLITNSENNLEKINNILKDKDITQFDSSEIKLVETLLKDLKELGKNRIEDNQSYKEFSLLSSEKLYLLNIESIIKYGSEILEKMRYLFRDLFLGKPIKFKQSKGGIAFKTKR